MRSTYKNLNNFVEESSQQLARDDYEVDDRVSSFEETFLEEEDPCNGSDARVAEDEIDDGALSSSSKKRRNNVSGVTKRPKWRSKQVENTGEAALLETLEKGRGKSGSEKDGAYIFGEYVACSIRKLGQRQQIMARNKISNTTFRLCYDIEII